MRIAIDTIAWYDNLESFSKQDADIIEKELGFSTSIIALKSECMEADNGLKTNIKIALETPEEIDLLISNALA